VADVNTASLATCWTSAGDVALVAIIEHSPHDAPAMTSHRGVDRATRGGHQSRVVSCDGFIFAVEDDPTAVPDRGKTTTAGLPRGPNGSSPVASAHETRRSTQHPAPPQMATQVQPQIQWTAVRVVPG